MSFSVRISPAARADIVRLYRFIVERDNPDWFLAERAIKAIEDAMDLLGKNPFSCRKASADTPFLRELIIPFGAAGYVALFEIDNAEWVTVLAVRHQLEEDYH